MVKFGLSCLIAISLFFSCGENTTSLNEFCGRWSLEKPENLNFVSCKKGLKVCTPKELYDPGTTPPCYYAKGHVKKLQGVLKEVSDERNKS